MLAPVHAKKDKDAVLDSINRRVSRIARTILDYTPISQADIPYTIPGPGNYRLVENVTYTGSVPAITNSYSNVDVDLNGFTINLGGQGLIGIFSSGSDIQIYNGSIVNGNLAATVADDIIFYNVSLTDPLQSPNPSSFSVRTAGISLTGANNVTLTDLNIDSLLYGIASVNTGSNIYVSNVNTPNCGSYTEEPNLNPAAVPPATLLEPVGAGLFVAGSSIQPIIPQPADPTFAGFATNINVEQSNFSCSQSHYGALFVSCNNVNIHDCTGGAGRLAVTSNPVGSATGVYLTASAVFTFINSQFGRVVNCQLTSGNTGIGMYWSKAITAENVHIADTAHNGIEALFTYDCSAFNCVASRESDSEANVFNGRGFLAIGSTDTIYDHCTASNFTLANTPTAAAPRSAATSLAATNGYGFVVFASQSCLVNECIAMNNIGGFVENPNYPATFAITYPGGSLDLLSGSTGSANDWNAWTKNIALNNVNSATEFGTPLNNYNFIYASWQPVPGSYTNIDTISAWSNVSVPM